MSPDVETRFPGTLPATWLAQRAGVDPARIDVLRRAGELIAVREPGSSEWRYPAWQFEDGKPAKEVLDRIGHVAMAALTVGKAIGIGV